VKGKKNEVYVRDAQGNVLAVYEVKVSAVADSLFVKEFNIFGTERIGYMQERNYINKKCNTPLCSTITLNNPIGSGSTMKTISSAISIPTLVLGSGSSLVSVYYGKKRYELSDWLGNVRVVVSDKKVPDNVSGNVVLNYKPEIISIRDYYAYGSEINERSFEPIKPKYRYGFNTQEKVFEINKDHYTARYWEYDSRLGRRWNVDPKPTVGFSEYAVNMDDPISKNDPEGNVSGDPPGKFGVIVGARIGLGSSGLNFNITGSVGYQLGSDNKNISMFLSGSIYGGSQLGTGPKGGFGYDISGGTYLTIGKGTGTPHNFYTLN
jgi:RHS repeat-associated protein